ncbi:MAG: Holliday junction branch migration protein RuvA [Ignavibacteria bacterium]
MLEYIKGILISKKLTSIIVDSNGIGFGINITLPAYEILPKISEEVKIITHFHIKENPFAVVLYGFSDERERECFRQIISVTGIGPKTAMNLLSAIGYNEFTELIVKGDFQPLTTITGIGRKTAERLVVELKDKLAKAETEYIRRITHIDGEISKLSEISGALISLGYSRPETDKMVKKISESGKWQEMSIEDMIKEILRGR